MMFQHMLYWTVPSCVVRRYCELSVCLSVWLAGWTSFHLSPWYCSMYSDWVTARSEASVCGRSLAGIAGSNPTGGMDVSLFSVLCVLSGRGLCDELITRPEDSYRLWCAWVWLWNIYNEEALAHWWAVRLWGVEIVTRLWDRQSRTWVSVPDRPPEL